MLMLFLNFFLLCVCEAWWSQLWARQLVSTEDSLHTVCCWPYGQAWPSNSCYFTGQDRCVCVCVCVWMQTSSYSKIINSHLFFFFFKIELLKGNFVVLIIRQTFFPFVLMLTISVSINSFN